ncbi:MAG: hypothetical protein QM642_11060 [Edaphocola sp.]
MYKYPIVVVLLLMLCVHFPDETFAQKEYRLTGFMGVQGGESFTYQLVLKDSTGNYLNGYALTYLNQKNDVKALVTAVIDKDKKTLRIKEEQIVYNNYFESRALICLVEAVLTYKEKEKTLSGLLITATAGNGAGCAQGSISFAYLDEINQLFGLQNAIQETPMPAPIAPHDTLAKKILPKKPTRIIYDTAAIGNTPPAKPPATNRPASITEGTDQSYLWATNEIGFEIWDGNNEDNDRVTILYNGNEVLKSIVLKNEHRKITLPIGGNELNIVTIVADNEGGDPPNTANIRLLDGKAAHEVIAHNKVGKRAVIKIRKHPK